MARYRCQLGQILRERVSGFPHLSWEELGLSGLTWDTVYRLARDRRVLFSQPPTSPAALESSCVTVACASMQAGAVMATQTVMTSLMSATAVSEGMTPKAGAGAGD